MTTYNRLSGTNVQRIEALSDALYAIALTLTVLEVRVPSRQTTMTEGELRAAVFQLGPRVLTYLLSFMTLGIFWVGNQTFLSHVRRSNRHLTWLVLANLAVIALMPISTGLLPLRLMACARPSSVALAPVAARAAENPSSAR